MAEVLALQGLDYEKYPFTGNSQKLLAEGLLDAQKYSKHSIIKFLNRRFSAREQSLISTLGGLSPQIIMILDKLRKGEGMTDLEIRAISLKLVENFPYVNILRMSKGDVLRNFHFAGVKKLNDEFGQLFTDQIIHSVKTRIAWNIRRNKLKEASRRVIRSDYKYLTYSSKNTDISLEDFFDLSMRGLGKGELKNLPEVKDIIELVAFREFMISLNKKGVHEFNGFSTAEADLDSSILSCPDCFRDLKNSVMSHESGGLDALDIRKNQMKVKAKIAILERIGYLEKSLDNLEVTLGQSVVESEDYFSKFVTFFKAERAAVMAHDSKESSYMAFDEELVKKYVSEIYDLEEKIFAMKGKVFVEVGQKKQVITGNKINPLLLESVRKRRNIGNQELFDLVRMYISKINSIADCMKGSIYENMLNDFNLAMNIDLLIKAMRNTRSGEKFSDEDIWLLSMLLKVNQKGVVTKKIFKEYVSSTQDGVLGFSDIKNMGIENIQEFREIIGKLIDDKGQLDYSKVLTAGDRGTKKLFEFVYRLKKTYGEHIMISMGGDEIYRYISGIDFDINDINALMKKCGLQGRHMYKKLSAAEDFNVDKEINALDKSSSVIKFLETRISQVKYSVNEKFDGQIDFDIGDTDAMLFEKDKINIEQQFRDVQFGRDLIAFVNKASVGSLFKLGRSLSGSDYYLVKKQSGYAITYKKE